MTVDQINGNLQRYHHKIENRYKMWKYTLRFEIECKICNSPLTSNKRNLSNHLRKRHNTTFAEYKKQYLSAEQVDTNKSKIHQQKVFMKLNTPSKEENKSLISKTDGCVETGKETEISPVKEEMKKKDQNLKKNTARLSKSLSNLDLLATSGNHSSASSLVGIESGRGLKMYRAQCLICKK